MWLFNIRDKTLKSKNLCHRESGWLSNISYENIILWTNVTNDKHLHKAITIL